MPRPQFSLRLLLLALTGVCVGFPAWYRWPYRETVTHHDLVNGQPDSSRPQSVGTTTWQRQWCGRRTKHGPSITWRSDENTIIVEFFRGGLRHGPYLLVGDYARAEGCYCDGQKVGEWTEKSLHPFRMSRSHWVAGRRQGMQSGIADLGHWNSSFDVPVANGHLESTPDICKEHPLIGLAKAGAIESQRVAEALNQPAAVDLDMESLAKVVATIEKQYHIPIETDECDRSDSISVACYAFSMGPVVTGKLDDADLAAVLVMIAQLRGLCCDYRYGCVWLARRGDPQPWHDPTGIAEIVPPPGSRFAELWDREINYSVREESIAKVLDSLGDELAVHIDTSELRPRGDESSLLFEVMLEQFGSGVELEVSDHPFRHVLGILLYRTGCRCRLEGDTLVIQRPDRWQLAGSGN